MGSAGFRRCFRVPQLWGPLFFWITDDVAPLASKTPSAPRSDSMLKLRFSTLLSDRNGYCEWRVMGWTGCFPPELAF
jgi:hypothetical protein